jgi:hypothetical protein
MVRSVDWAGRAALVAALGIAASTAYAQDIDLGAGGADTVWRGTVASGNVGAWMDQGAVSAGDNRRDLIIGAPGPGAVGAVYVLYGGPVRHGDQSLNNADVIINGVTVGDLFGYSTAAGNILNTEGAIPRDLVVGAPGAGGSSRGQVFLFAGGFGANERLDTTAAVLVITGAAGDLLGASLATGDLNNDGHREMIIGAPGNNRVYIINGGAGLSGTIDLGTTAAHSTISLAGSGIGGVLTAGDVTGDGIYDIFIGAPDTNRVYLITGKPGGLPAAIDLATTSDAVFGGIDDGDRAGQAIRILDLDGDGLRDFMIGAPAADGPGNTRPDGGEVYVFFGSAGFAGSLPASINLSSADVTFFGANAGDGAGTGISGGDINRDFPNDAVILAPGGPGSTAELYIYYGRARGSIGVVGMTGIREVDLSISSQFDRRVVGDETIGAINSSQVFEVTGEGARDVVAGVTATDGGAGAVYFTISPRMVLTQTTVSRVVTQGMSATAAAQIVNVSAIGITWTSLSSRSWLSASPSSGSSVASAAGDFNVVINTTGLDAGTHTGTIFFSSTSTHLEMTLSLEVTVKVAPADRVAGDFDGDGSADLLFRNSSDGTLIGWAMNGINRLDAAFLDPGQVADINWNIVGTGDFNGDRNPDIVWHHNLTGAMAVWFMNGLTRLSDAPLPALPAPWKVMAVGDLNGDGHPDLVIQNRDDGFIAVWLMNGTTLIDGQMLNPSQVSDTHWTVVGLGDFNADGRQDLLWHHAMNGRIAVWFMNGINQLDVQFLNPGAVGDTGWRIKGVADMNADGHPDLLWQHTNSTIALWFMNGINMTSAEVTNPSTSGSTALKLVGPR